MFMRAACIFRHQTTGCSCTRAVQHVLVDVSPALSPDVHISDCADMPVWCIASSYRQCMRAWRCPPLHRPVLQVAKCRLCRRSTAWPARVRWCLLLMVLTSASAQFNNVPRTKDRLNTDLGCPNCFVIRGYAPPACISSRSGRFTACLQKSECSGPVTPRASWWHHPRHPAGGDQPRCHKH